MVQDQVTQLKVSLVEGQGVVGDVKEKALTDPLVLPRDACFAFVHSTWHLSSMSVCITWCSLWGQAKHKGSYFCLSYSPFPLG